MSRPSDASSHDEESWPAIPRTLASLATGGLMGLSALALYLSLWKLLGIAWFAYASMRVGEWLGRSSAPQAKPTRLVWGHGVASGAMLTSACLFLVPPAIDYHRSLGGLGIAAGLIAGFALHTAWHQLTHRTASILDYAVAELTLHSLGAGVIIGAVYTAMPSLGPTLGFAIVSHKAPAGFATARRLTYRGRPTHVIQLPAAGVGLSALSVGALGFSTGPAWNGLIFGLATGVFLHVAIDFLPACEIGGDIDELTDMGDDHHELRDRLRLHALAAPSAGGAAVVALWSLL